MCRHDSDRGMLCLTLRDAGSMLVIGEGPRAVEIRCRQARNGRVKIVIVAPRDLPIRRSTDAIDAGAPVESTP